MDWLELLWNACVGCSLGLPIWALAAIALRVACHWSGVEIPALGRAMLVVGATVVPTIALGVLLQVLFVGPDGQNFHPVLQFLVFAITLFVNAAICVGAYTLLLRARVGQALTLWLASSLLFVVAAGCVGCAIAVPYRMIEGGI